jgi:hypothetical protein
MKILNSGQVNFAKSKKLTKTTTIKIILFRGESLEKRNKSPVKTGTIISVTKEPIPKR